MDNGIKDQSKKRNSKLEEIQPRKRIDSLPPEIALDILSRLPITSLLQSRFVCRACFSLSHDQNLVNLHLSRAPKQNPFVVLHCDYPIRNQLYFVELSDLFYKEKVRKFDTPFCASMPEFNIVGSCNGLLCLSDSLYCNAIYIYNPFTRDCKELPKSREYQDQVVVFGFGFHPITNEYKVVKIIYYWNTDAGFWPGHRIRTLDNSQSEVQVFGLRSNTWRSIGKVPYQLDQRSSKVVLTNGSLHWVIKPGRYYNLHGRMIVSFDIADEQFREVPRPEIEGQNRYNFHLAILEGCLSVVIYCYNGELEIWVTKEYDVKESWMKEFRIGAYSPESLNQDLQLPHRIWKNTFNRAARVLGVLKNGKILVEYSGGTLATYDPGSGEFKEVMFPGMPKIFQAIMHMGSLNWI